MTKYIFIVGGVMSGIGKGVSTASLGRILKDCGFRVSCIKIDPYLNIDAGTMNPVEHGEVFITEDGLECDQDIGNYERFLDGNMHRTNYMTTGQVYRSVIEKERNLEYGGKCVETVPHIPEEIIKRIERAGNKDKADFVLVEVGGTVGEYQNLIFLEAGRMMKLRNPNSVIFVMVSYLPVPKMVGEMKTKPTQHAVRALNTAGIQPDIVIARAVTALDKPRKRKIGVFCNVSEEDVIPAPDIESIYDVPVNFEKAKLSVRILKKFGLKPRKSRLGEWKKYVRQAKIAPKKIKIGIVGKYFTTGKFTLSDSYISVIEAIKHASAYNRAKPEIIWLDAENYNKNSAKLKKLKEFNCLIVPGGFGERGAEGKIKVIKYARENNIPFLGLCYGMQLAVIEFARNVLGLKNAHTTEINPDTKNPVISTMPEQETNIKESNFGGSMRLGAYPCTLLENSVAYKLYGERNILERHRHRYEFNNFYKDKFEDSEMYVSGTNPQNNLAEIIEIKNHPFFVGTQFHPELKSRPLRPHPLFKGLIKAGVKLSK